MAKFRVRVSTGEAFGAGTWDKMSVSIVGTRGETPPLPLDHLGKEFNAGAVSAWEVGVGAEEVRIKQLQGSYFLIVET